jgi:hypothetical protein
LRSSALELANAYVLLMVRINGHLENLSP